MQLLGEAMDEVMENRFARMRPELAEKCRDAYYRGKMEQRAYNLAIESRTEPPPMRDLALAHVLREQDERQNQRDMEAMLQRSGLEPAERSWRLDFLADKEGKKPAMTQAQAILMGQPQGWVTLSGQHGVGKSGILKSLVAGFIRRGIPARYVNAAQMLADIRSTFGSGAENSESQVLNKYAGVRVLAVDEFDIIPDTGFAVTETRLLLDTRYNKRHDHLTLLATNADLGKETLPKEWQFMASRMSDGERIFVGGHDLRDRRNLRVAKR